MLTKNNLNIIDKYVNNKYFDKDKLIKYLEMHSVVGNEIFSYCDNRVGRENSVSYSTWLDDKYGYRPLSTENFIHRIPFYFYVLDYSNNRAGDLHCLISGIIREEKSDGDVLETLYQALENLFYEKNISLDDIFNYIVEQTGYVSETQMFFRWKHYIELCDEFRNEEYFPDCFVTSYNEMLEKKGLAPIIYEVNELFMGDVSWRRGTQIEFEGVFPYDPNGQPIMKWIGIRTKNAKSITCSQDKSSRGRLFVDITPDTTIHALNCYNYDGGDDCWYQIYAGPKTMAFDYKILKERRKRLKYTQQEIADAIGATVRTYQKWESGSTTPDGHYLLRLLNWLDIRDVQDIVKYIE